MFFLLSCNSKQDTDIKAEKITSESEKPYLKFENEKYDFGEINGNDKKSITTDFVFTNKNNRPIIIRKADVSCGCISTEIPKKPILKGEKGFIKVTLDVNQLNGHFEKTIFIKSNAENNVELLRVTGTVKR